MMIKRSIQRVDENSSGEGASPLITVDDLVSTPCSGLLVAEGGMGKSTFLKELGDRLGKERATLIKLAYFTQNPQGLVSEMGRVADAIPDGTLILDGLDEAVDLAGTICWYVENLPETFHVWVASRACQQLEAVSKSLKKTARYRLLPFTKDDIKTRAKEENLDVSNGERIFQEHNLWDICGNPLGCDFVLKAFKQNQEVVDWTSREIWRQGILTLCDENLSSTKALDNKVCRFSPSQIFECAAWIALNLSLSGKNAVFMGVREIDCPASAVPISVLMSGENTRDLILVACQRGLFASWSPDCFGFAHATYSDYLVADGFQKHVPRDQWESLLIDQENRCLFAQRVGITQWLMTADAALADEVFELSPERFLTRDLALMKMDRLCQALLDRAAFVVSQLVWDARRSLRVLKSQATLETLRTFFFKPYSKDDDFATDLAIDIARECEYWELLAEFSLDETRSDMRRQEAVLSLGLCPDISTKRRLRPLLDRWANVNDQWRGSLLMVCWPDVLSVDELFPFVVRPSRLSTMSTSRYWYFLRYRFMEPLLERLDPVGSTRPLAWANEWLKEAHGNSMVSDVKECAQAVYTRYWNYAGKVDASPFVPLLADGYLAACEHYESPFFVPREESGVFFDSVHHNIPKESVCSHETFVGQRELRFAILKEIIARKALQSMNGLALGSEWSLIQDEEDRIRVAETILSAPHDKDTEKWTLLLRWSWDQHFLETQGELIDRIHGVRPDMFPKTCDELLSEEEKYRKQRIEKEIKHKATMEKAAAERAAWQRQVDHEIKEALATDGTPPEHFAGVSAHLFTENGGFKGWDFIDLRQAVGWKKLTGTEQEQMIQFAKRFLIDAPPSGDEVQRGTGLAWHRALFTLKHVKPEEYEKLSEAVWRKCGVELLRFTLNDASRELCDDLARKFPAVASEVLLRCLPHEYGVAVLREWGERLTEAQAEAVWDALFGSVPCDVDDAHPNCCFVSFPEVNHTPYKNPVCDQILSCLTHYQPAVLRRRVNERLKDGFAIHLGHPFFDVLRRYAIQLESEKYFSVFLQTLTSDKDWGRHFLESAAAAYAWHHEGGFDAAFFTRSAEEIGKLYEWLEGQYPLRNQPRPEPGGVCHSTTYIYEFKGKLFTFLVNSGKKGSARVLEGLMARSPGGFKGHISTAQRNEAAARIPFLTADEIRQLVEEKKAVIVSIYDLQRYILALLEDYQIRLHGNPPIVGRLWNTKKPVSPKKEEEFSLDVVCFLKDRMDGAIFANREVQISPKMAEGGTTGTRTDIWIDCETVCKKKVSLCIEVKCSWNQEAKTAISDQLVGRYMSDGRADAGILLLAWFHCAAWKAKKKSVWNSPLEAITDLENQAKAIATEKPLNAVVLDCTL